jgi:glycosyltransferase involved in cell wall biosynthesis
LIFETADNKKGGLFNLGDVYIYPTYVEGVGLTITEAMSTGLPVVTTNFPTMNEWIDDDVNGILINVSKVEKWRRPTMKAYSDTKHLSEIMIDYIENPEKVNEHSLNAREKIEKNYNWDDRDKDFYKLLEL